MILAYLIFKYFHFLKFDLWQWAFLYPGRKDESQNNVEVDSYISVYFLQYNLHFGIQKNQKKRRKFWAHLKETPAVDLCKHGL